MESMLIVNLLTPRGKPGPRAATVVVQNLADPSGSASLPGLSPAFQQESGWPTPLWG